MKLGMNLGSLGKRLKTAFKRLILCQYSTVTVNGETSQLNQLFPTSQLPTTRNDWLTRAHIQSLPLIDDIFWKILSLCDLLSVISASQTCKHFHDLVFNYKEVWLGLLANLCARNFIDPISGYNPQLERLSTNALIDLVNRVVHGPRSWSSHHLSGQITRHISLNPLSQRQSFTSADEAKLLPGGQFVLFTHTGNLRCWNVAEDRFVWEYQRLGRGVKEFAVDMANKGRAATIAICVEAWSASDTFVEIVSLDLFRGISHPVFLRNGLFSKPLICGNFAIIQLERPYRTGMRRRSADKFLFVKLSTQSCFSLDVEERGTEFVLIPGYAILVERERQWAPRAQGQCHYFLRLDVWDIDYLINFMTRVRVYREPMPSPLHSKVISPSEPLSDFYVSAHASPLQEDLYAIWILLEETNPNRIYRCQLSVNKPQQVSLQEIGSQLRDLPRNSKLLTHSGISYAGAVLVRHGHLYWIHETWPLPPRNISGTAEVPGANFDAQWQQRIRGNFMHLLSIDGSDAALLVHMSASGALTFCQDKKIVIQYYE